MSDQVFNRPDDSDRGRASAIAAAEAWKPTFRRIWRFHELLDESCARAKGLTAQLVFGLVVPAVDISPDGCRRLGNALTEWLLASQPQCAWSVEIVGRLDLLAGELPKPLTLRLSQLGRLVPELLNGIQDLERPEVWAGPGGGRLMSLALCAAVTHNPDGSGDHRNVQIAAIGGPQFSREQIVESLRDAIPAELVDDITLDGASWSEQ